MTSKLGPAADERALGRRNKSLKVYRKQLAEDIRFIAENPSGLRVLAWIIRDACRLNRTYDAALPDGAAHFDDGRRAAGGAVLSMVRALCGSEVIARLGVELLSEPTDNEPNEAEDAAEENNDG